MSEWYNKNRERILAEKRKKYAQDKEYRDKKKEKTLDNYHKKKVLTKPDLSPCMMIGPYMQVEIPEMD